MIIKRVNDKWTEVPDALNEEKEYTALKGEEIASTSDGYVGEVELMYATHREVFDSLSPASLREKNFQYILLKQQEANIKKEMDLLKSEIVALHSALDNKADMVDAGSAGTIQFQEVKKAVYDDKAIEQIKQLSGNTLFEEKVSEKKIKAFEKEHPELKEKIEAIRTYKTELKMVIKPNPEFVMPEKDAVDEMFKEEREKACSERYRIYKDVHALAESYENKTIKLSEAEVLKSQMEILKNEYTKIRKEELINETLNEMNKESPSKDEMEMN